MNRSEAIRAAIRLWIRDYEEHGKEAKQ
jgi:Arc/MetJ-type ribon-helix-helix transcriptional regulator